MKRVGNWAVFLATLVACASVGMSAMAGPGSLPPPATTGGAPDRPGPAVPGLARAGALEQQPAPASGYSPAELSCACVLARVAWSLDT